MTIECYGICTDGEPIHTWFGLSYANYLVLPRSVLQSMPLEWQRRFVACLEELMVAAEDHEFPAEYSVNVRDDNGRFQLDWTPHYNRGRTRVPLKDLSEVVHVEAATAWPSTETVVDKQGRL